MGITTQHFQGADLGLDWTACLSVSEGQQSCWEQLFRSFTAKLAQAEKEHQTAQTQCDALAERCKQLEEQLEAAQTSERALLEASKAQTRQFSETLKQLRQNQAQIVQAEKMSSLGQLVAGVAHEINNPVNFIYGNLSHATEYTQDLMQLLQLYQRHYPHPVPEIEAEMVAIELPFLMEDLPKLLSSLKVGAERIQKIVLSLRSFSRMDEAEVKEVDIHEGIESTLMILQNRLKVKSDRPAITIVKNYGDIPLVECHAGQLNQVFMNLLSNAVDALEEKLAIAASHPTENADSVHASPIMPTISISTQPVGTDRVQIRIADNGPGIPVAVQPRLFDPFFTTKPVGKGTGLGLSISYQVVTETHGGTLQCLSIPGEGAEFVMEIPVRSRWGDRANQTRERSF